jgi:enoyl-CoA hydratase/carnithine racemase
MEHNVAFVDYTRHDNTGLIRINRPERLNALGVDVLTQLAEAFIECRDDPQVRVVILTGTERSFCVGMDIKEQTASGATQLSLPDIRPLVNPYWDPTAAIRPSWGPDTPLPLGKPVIAAVNGFAFGGGFFLAARSSLCIASTSATFEISEILRGGQAGWDIGFTESLPRHIAVELALGTRMSAERLYSVGFVNQLVSPGELIDRSLAEAERIASLPPLAVRAAMELVSSLVPTVPDAVIRRAAQLRREVFGSADAAESLRAFIERRAPVYSGE